MPYLWLPSRFSRNASLETAISESLILDHCAGQGDRVTILFAVLDQQMPLCIQPVHPAGCTLRKLALAADGNGDNFLIRRHQKMGWRTGKRPFSRPFLDVCKEFIKTFRLRLEPDDRDFFPIKRLISNSGVLPAGICGRQIVTRCGLFIASLRHRGTSWRVAVRSNVSARRTSDMLDFRDLAS